MTTNLVNNKKYIGLDTKNNPNYYGSGKAFKLALKKYGKHNFRKEILCYCGSMEELLLKEEYYIKLYNADKSEDFYNIAVGGGKFRICPIVQYTLNGEVVKTYSSIVEAEQETGFNNSKITACAKGNRWQAYSYIWRYYGEPFDKYPTVKRKVTLTEEQRRVISLRQTLDNSMKNRIGKENPRSKSVSQYDLQGNFIRSWDSITEAQKELGINNISYVLIGRRKKAGGFIWKYNEDIVQSSEKSE